MHNYKKALVGAASVLALAAAGNSAANASVPRFDKQAETTAPAAGLLSSGSYSDPLFDLILRTKGDLSSEAAESTLIEMFSGASGDKVEHLPQLLTDVMALGVTPDTVARIKNALIDVVASNSSIEDGLRESVIAELGADAKLIQVAQTNERRKRPRDPDIVGQTGGGGGGAGPGGGPGGGY
jgi:hypothetical protein